MSASTAGQFRRRIQEFSLIFRDPVLAISLVLSALFLLTFVLVPILSTAVNGFFDAKGNFNIVHFQRYFDAYYGPLARQVFGDTMILGILTATGGTLLGFIIAYAVVRCRMPGRRFIHLLALVPTISPPFAIALATIFLFGRNGAISHGLLGINFVKGSKDIYGMEGLVFVQVITFFSVAYLILRAMLERLDPSMEEAARGMGAGKLHVFRTVTLPLLIPGIASSFLLLFVEALADLGNPLLISGNVTVLSAQIFLAVAGEYDYQKASALAVVLLIPTVVIFIVQRYYVTRRSYVSVTGKPTGGTIEEKEGWIRWPFIIITYAACALIIILYAAIVFGSFTMGQGANYAFSLFPWEQMFARGIESILDTTFLSMVATPVAVLLGMVIAFQVVRKKFSGKEILDFSSNLGGAVPGTILGIGFVLVFGTSPLALVALLFGVMLLFCLILAGRNRREKIGVGLASLALGTALKAGEGLIGTALMLYLVCLIVLLFGFFELFVRRQRRLGLGLVAFAVYGACNILVEYAAFPLTQFSRSLPVGALKNAITQLPDYLLACFQLPLTFLGCGLMILAVVCALRENGRVRPVLLAVLLGAAFGLVFAGKPLALVGTPYIILAAFAVRSLPASVRAGVASLQQIDPSIEEASAIMGADAQYTFRKVTLPLIMPALIAGMIFSFTRHMTSLSAIIFLVSAKWRIITASILSEWEQGGIPVAAAYSTIIIVFVLAAIGVMYIITNRMVKRRGGIDITWSA